MPGDQGIKRLAKGIDAELASIAKKIRQLQEWLAQALTRLRQLQSLLACESYVDSFSIEVGCV